jgi:hypothetical protein
MSTVTNLVFLNFYRQIFFAGTSFLCSDSGIDQAHLVACMTLSKLFFALFCGLFFFSFALRTEAATPSVLEKCEDIEKARNQKKSNPSVAIPELGIFDYVKIVFTTNHLIQVGLLKDGKILQLPETTDLFRPTVNRSLIITPTIPKNDPSEIRAQIQQAAHLYQSMKAKQDLLAAQPTVEACMKKASELSLTDRELLEFDQEMQKGMKAHESQYALFLADQLKDKTTWDPGFQTAQANGYKEILTTLNAVPFDGNPTDLVLTFHATEEGVLVDHRGLFVPRSFFQKLSPMLELRSLVIYSCFSEKVVQFYADELRQLQAERRTKIFFPISSGPLKNLPVASARLLGTFLTKQRDYIRRPTPYPFMQTNN